MITKKTKVLRDELKRCTVLSVRSSVARMVKTMDKMVKTVSTKKKAKQKV